MARSLGKKNLRLGFSPVILSRTTLPVSVDELLAVMQERHGRFRAAAEAEQQPQ